MRTTERGLLLVGTVVLFAVAIAFFILGEEVSEDSFGSLSLLLWPPGFAVAGAIITRRAPHHAVGRLLMWAGFSAGVITVGLGLQVWVATPVEELDGWMRIAAEALGSIWVVPIICLFAAIARFPDGDWATPWVGRFFWLFAVSFGAGVPLAWIDPDETGVLWDWSSMLSGGAVLGIVLLLLVHLVRSVRSDPIRRRQYAWVVGGLVVSGALWTALAGVLTSLEWLGPISFLIFPMTLVIAITRYRLYEIDRIVSRTVTYVVVIGVLAAVYAGLVLGLRSLLPGVEGPLPVALSTLAVAFAFFPLARRVQGFVDRRFFRSRYDAAAVVAAFADELRTTLDPSVAAGRAESVVAETFQAESVAVWLAEEPA